MLDIFRNFEYLYLEKQINHEIFRKHLETGAGVNCTDFA